MADAGDPPPPLCPLCGHPTPAATSSASPAALLRPPLLKRRGGPPEAPPAVVRVEIGDEAAALREALARQQAALGDLQAELDAERGAAAGAASEAMTMILRLQREKAEAMMEARQFRRYAEEKMAHDAAELAGLEDAVAKRDAALLRAASIQQQQQNTPRHLHHVASGASTPRRGPVRPPASPSPAASSGGGGGGYYPALRCFIDHPPTASEADALDAQITPRDQLSRLAHRIHLLERNNTMTTATPAAAAVPTTTPIIRVAPGSTFPRAGRHHHARAYSDDGSSSLDFCGGNRGDFFPDDDDDDCGVSDRVYTVDAIHGAPMAVPEGSCYGGGSTPVGSDCCGGRGAPWGEDNEEVRRLSSRLQSLEADRESMRQAIINMGAEKAQVMLLKEIAQKLCREAAAPPVPTMNVAQQSYYKAGNVPPAVTVTVRPPRQAPVTMHRTTAVVKRQPGTSFLATMVKWVTSIIWWRKKSSRTKYPIGQCGNNVGLLLLLEKAPRAGHGHQRPPKKI
ncbi:hypothetical protein QOZ80_5AG0390480 [Eleusine coracana subsp. coracana]|nr:hypothetical protein QOZ80_5AG0390480 [Eleusine coracana subsp. coracana]